MTSFDQQHQKVDIQFNVGTISIQLHATQNVAGLLKKAVRLLQISHYDEALILLDKVLLEDDEIADAYYYHALATLKGKRPKSTLKTSADKISSNLKAAIELDKEQAHYYYFLALVLYDFYVMNGFSVKPGEIDYLIAAATNQEMDKPRCEELLQHTNNPDSPIASLIKERL